MTDSIPPTLTHPVHEPTPSWVGQVVDGYEVVELLGQGGMGRVYRAVDQRLGRQVAIKTVIAPPLHREEFFARFAREARVLSQVRHPNVAQIYSAGDHEGVPYYAMELIEGGSLDRVLAEGRRLAGSRCLTYLMEAAAGLQEAHRQGLVHRDVKPSNLMLESGPREQDRHLKLVDFGLARRIDEGDSLTRTQSVLGTPRYMAPEQILGQTLDHRSDIYSLGATFYHLFCGEPPFPGAEPLGVGLHHLQTPLTPLRERNPHVPKPVAAIIGKMMEKKPEDRYNHYGELIEDLRRAQRGLLPRFARAPKPPAPTRQAASPLRTRLQPRRWMWMGAGLGVVVLALLLVAFGRSGAGNPPGATPTDNGRSAARTADEISDFRRLTGRELPVTGSESESAEAMDDGLVDFSPMVDPVEEPVRPTDGVTGFPGAPTLAPPPVLPRPSPEDRPEPGARDQRPDRRPLRAPASGDRPIESLAAQAARAIPIAQSLSNMRALATNVTLYAVERGSVPASVGQLLEETPLASQSLQDGWGRPLRYRSMGRDHYRIRSAGPDGRFGSRDDLVIEDGRLIQGPGDLLGG